MISLNSSKNRYSGKWLIYKMFNKTEETIFDYRPKSATEWLLAIVAGGLLLSNPYGAKFVLREIKRYVKNKSELNTEELPKNLSVALYNAQKRKLINIETLGDQVSVTLTEKGTKRVIKYNSEKLTIAKPEKWDHRWRIVMFDIPEGRKWDRDKLREKLIQLKFVRFQKSIWIYPYPCASIIDALGEAIGVRKYITILTVQIEDDLPLRREFNL